MFRLLNFIVYYCVLSPVQSFTADICCLIALLILCALQSQPWGPTSWEPQIVHSL